MRHQANLKLLTGRQKDHLSIRRKNWVPTVETDALEEVSDLWRLRAWDLQASKVEASRLQML